MSFEQAHRLGLSSSTFNIGKQRDDSRHLSDAAGGIVQAMNKDSLSFDEARLHSVKAEMARWGIDATGMPSDPKTFTFDKLPVRRQSARSSAGPESDDSTSGSGVGSSCYDAETQSEGVATTASASSSPSSSKTRGLPSAAWLQEMPWAAWLQELPFAAWLQVRLQGLLSATRPKQASSSAWWLASLNGLAPWPSHHFMRYVQLSCLLVGIVFIIGFVRYLRKQIWSIAGIPEITLQQTEGNG